MNHIRKFDQNLAYYFSRALNRPLAKPLWVYISLSHDCTYNCQMCGVVKILKGHRLEMADVKEIFNEMSGWDWDFTVVITGGEPFLRNDIFEVFRCAQEANLKIEVVTNGSLISRDTAESIMLSGLNNIAVSLDGAREETHDSIREKGAFGKAAAAIRELAEAKKRNGGGPQISVWTTIMKENVEELFEIIPLVGSLGAECLVYHPVIVVQDDMQNTSSNARFWLKGDDIAKLKEQIDKISDYQKKHGLVAFLHDPYLWLKHFKGELTKKEWSCNPFAFINIGPDGEVRSCGSAFGNAKQISLDACLNTAEARKARKTMKHCTKPCLQTCWANPESDSLTNIVDTFIRDLQKDDIDSGRKKELLNSALAKITDYEDLLKRCPI